MNRHILDALPIWGVLVLTVLLGLVMVEFRLSSWHLLEKETPGRRQ